MMGIAYLGAFAIYLAISAWIVVSVVRWSRCSGRSARKWGWGAGIVLYLIPFWDLLPTIVTHQVLCATAVDSVVHTKAEQWLERNRGESILPRPSGDSYSQDAAGNRIRQINSRLTLRRITDAVWPLPTRTSKEQIIDTKTGQVLIEQRSVYSGVGRTIRLWLNFEPCEPSNPEYREEMTKYFNIERQ